MVTIGTGTSTAQVATAIKNAIMASARLDGTDATGESSNFGGREFGEFAEITASIDSDTPTVVDLIAVTPGKPFTFSATEATAGSGTATGATVQAATGRHYWSNSANWSGGSVPANDDTVVFRDSNVSCKYGLPAGSLEVTLIVHQSFTGTIGLPETNNDNPSLPYYEYRARAVELDASGGGTNITHIFGFGEGVGSPLINVYHHHSTLVVNADVHNTGTPQTQGEFAQPAGAKALNLVITQTDGDGTINVRRGSVALGQMFGGNPEFATLRVGYSTGNINDADVLLHNHNDNDLAIVQYGGSLKVLHSDGNQSSIVTMEQHGGVAVFEDFSCSGGITITSYDGTIVWNTTQTVAALTLGTGGTLDAEKDVRPFTVTALNIYNQSKVFDEFSRITYTAGIDLNQCGLDDVQIRVGNNRRLDIGAVA